MKITIVAGARPNFVKIASLVHSLNNSIDSGSKISYRIVHTGQHYDKKMSADFFDELEIPEPNINLNIGSGSQAEQTAGIMIAFENELITHNPDIVIVVGDVTSTMACAITAKKLNIKVAHIEAGIRSNDLEMPEEINRLITDSITDYFFTTTKIASENLIKSGANQKNIFFVGNTMIDTLLKNQSKFRKPLVYDELNLNDKKFFIVTLHRPSNVDDIIKLEQIIKSIIINTSDYKIVFPIHPRTKNKIKSIKFDEKELNKIAFLDPLSYLEFNYLVSKSTGVITDSGGITEETTVLGIPCLTLRNNTERPETCIIGTNELIGDDFDKLKKNLIKIINSDWKTSQIPELWDGKTGDRIVKILVGLKNNP